MPQFVHDSDSDDVIAPTSKNKGTVRGARGSSRRTSKATEIESESEQEEVQEEPEAMDEDSDDIDDVEEYVVEKIVDHKFEEKSKKLLFHVKWKGYEKKSDMTWEPEENCLGAQEAINEYFADIGGRPEYNSPAPRKRSRQSLGTPASKATPKRPRTTVTTKNGAAESEEDSKWTPPAGKSWEEEVTIIDTIERNPDGELVCYVQWKDGNKSQHPIRDIYKKCPQRMLHFYEQHLVFKDTGAMG